MKIHGKMLVLFMFLFIYFLIPRNVFAVTEKGVCVCTGGTANGELILKSTNGLGSLEFRLKHWSGNAPKEKSYTENDRPTTNNSKFTIRAERGGLVCPAQIVISKSKISGIVGGKIYLYSGDYTREAIDWKNKINSKGCTGVSNCKYQEAEILSCVKQSTKTSSGESSRENPGNSVLPDTEEYEGYSSASGQTSNSSNGPGDGDDVKKPAARKNYSTKMEQHRQECKGVFGDTTTEGSVAWLLQKLFNYIRIFGILFMIVLSSIDFTKVVLSSDYNELKKVQNKLIFRIAGVVALLILPSLINFLLGLFISGTVNDFSCGIV